MNLEDIKNQPKATLEVEGLWFDRARFCRFMSVKMFEYREYLHINNIEIVPEVLEEIRKFMESLKTANKIDKKTCNFRLVFGDKDFDLRKRAEKWIWDYVDF